MYTNCHDLDAWQEIFEARVKAIHTVVAQLHQHFFQNIEIVETTKVVPKNCLVHATRINN